MGVLKAERSGFLTVTVSKFKYRKDQAGRVAAIMATIMATN